MMWIQFLRDRRASVAPIFAVALLPMLVATGAAIDFSRAFRQRTVVQDSLDAAALAAGKQLGIIKDDDVKQLAQDFYGANVGNKVDVIPEMKPDITAGQPTLTLHTALQVPTYFLGLIGIKQFTFNLVAQSTQAMGTIEVALALDNSTSMCLSCSAADQNNDSTKIGTLKKAAKSLVGTLYGLAATSTKPEPVKVSVVPFAGSVNVGPSVTWIDKLGLGTKNAMRDTGLLGAANAAPASFIPFSVFSTLKDSSGNDVTWGGCVETRTSPNDINDVPPPLSTVTSPTTDEALAMFEPMVAPDEPDNWTCTTSTCDDVGTQNSNRRYRGAPSGTQTYNNYLPDVVNTTFTVSKATPAVVTSNGHGLSSGDSVIVYTTGSLYTGLTAGSTYYVSTANLATNSFTLTAASSGTTYTVGPQYTGVTITNATPAVFTATGHGLTIGTNITLTTTNTLPGGLNNSTNYYVATVPSTSTFTVTTATAGTSVTFSGSTITRNSHGLTAGTAIAFKTTNTLPSPLNANTTYYVLSGSSNLTTNTFKVSTTTSGSAVSLSGGNGTLSYVVLQKTTSGGNGTHSYAVVGSPSLFSSSNHGLNNGDAVAVASTVSLPTPLSSATVYYVVNKSTNTFQLSTTSGGTGVTITGSSSGTLSFVKLVATTGSQSGTHSYAVPSAWTCQSGDAGCGGTGNGASEEQALGGMNVGNPQNKYGTTGSKATMSNVTVANLTGTGKGGPNFMCTTTPITPLTTTKTTVTDAITAMQANGYTNITEGLMWAWRSLSHGVPFAEGREKTVTDNKKIIVLMTDGENTYNPYLDKFQNPGSSSYAGKFVKSAYGAWSYTQLNHLGTNSTTSSDVFVKLNAKTAAACQAAKADGITIYTVGFEINAQTSSDPATALALLEGCASDPLKYYDAQNEAALEKAFTAIGDDISLLRLSM
ncbi:MAG: pilus assembly protein TadG-related protein [Bauldia sp.]